MIAIIKTGGKQYKVSPGQKIRIEKIDSKEGESVIFNEVLLVDNGKDVKIGTPFVEGTKIEGKIISQGKEDKKIIFKYKPKTRYKVKKGHRQLFTEVEILNFS